MKSNVDKPRVVVPARIGNTVSTDQTAQTAVQAKEAPLKAQQGHAPTSDHVDPTLHNAQHDMRYRVGVSALSGGPTTTAVPRLLEDWKVAVHEAAAEGLADVEVIAPVLTKALDKAEQAKGAPLSRKEARGIEGQVRDGLRREHREAFQAHHKDVTKTPTAKQQVERDVVLAERPRVAQLKDPFTPAIHNHPGARDNELVLWESKNFIVLVDTFANSPKALVVPKLAVNLPVDAPPGLLDEAALIAAHVSDAFMRATGCSAAGIWINAPQNLTVAQMHVHVLASLGSYSPDGSPAKVFIEDPAFRPQIEAWFAVIQQELVTKLGPTTSP